MPLNGYTPRIWFPRLPFFLLRRIEYVGPTSLISTRFSSHLASVGHQWPSHLGQYQFFYQLCSAPSLMGDGADESLLKRWLRVINYYFDAFWLCVVVSFAPLYSSCTPPRISSGQEDLDRPVPIGFIRPTGLWWTWNNLNSCSTRMRAVLARSTCWR